MKSLKKQLMAAIAMCLVAAVALGSSTYAWFVNNSKVQADGMTVNATADSSLVIAGDTNKDEGGKYKYGSLGTANLNISKLSPATSYDGLTFAHLSEGIKVQSAGDEKATWGGSEGTGTFTSTDLTTVEGPADATNGGYYATTTYSIKSIGEAANVYVSGITANTEADPSSIHKAVKMAIKIGSTTYVYNVGGGENNGEGVGKYATSWSLAEPQYKYFGTYDSTKSVAYALTADTATDVIVNIWYEGQDSNCYSDNINAKGVSYVIEFSKVPATS